MRRSGVLLHPTSLPGPYGIGDLGSVPALLAWLDSAGQRIWQVLPTNPVDDHGCPYASPSAFANSPLLLSVDALVRDGWLLHKERPFLPGGPHRVDWSSVHATRWPALWRAGLRAAEGLGDALDAWTAAHPWSTDWALYRSLQSFYGPRWPLWPAELRDRAPDALDRERNRLQSEIRAHLAHQYLFAQQWSEVRAEATRRGIALWGDLPIFVGAESCDVWTHRGLFRVDESGAPTVVSGVPPDAFSPNGQRWGHALYDWNAHAQRGFQWWSDRLQMLLESFDEVRLDHFRGLAACWEVPVDAEDARSGRWVPGPGPALLEAFRARFGAVPLIAEDLGVITPDVVALREDFGLPGMAILQFAFVGDPSHAYLPHNHRPNLVVYPGTHDNDTVRGWYDTAPAQVQDQVRRYLSVSGDDISWDLIRAANRSVADTVIVAMQDLLSLNGYARMNIPGQTTGNWSWRMTAEGFSLDLARRMADESRLTNRGELRPASTSVSSSETGVPQ